MSINMALQGAPDSLSIMILFLVITTLDLIMGVVLLKNIDRR
jgi:hypothetical protein